MSLSRMGGCSLLSFAIWMISVFPTTNSFLVPHLVVNKEIRRSNRSSSKDITIRPFGVHGRCPISDTMIRYTASSSSVTEAKRPDKLDEKQLDFTMGYLNKHHSDTLLVFAEKLSELGDKALKLNAWSGGSFKMIKAKLIDIDLEQMKLEVSVEQRGKQPTTEVVAISLDASPVKKNVIKIGQQESSILPPIPNEILENLHPVDHLVRKLNRLCWLVDHPHVTGKLIQLGIQIGGDGIGKLKENLYLNQVPHNRYVRGYFYDMAADAALEAVILCSQHKISNRMQIISKFPEMNPEMDSYRIGTILELTRAIAIRLIEQNLRVRVCVQGSMGVGIFTGVPKQLNGVSRLVQMMDWQSDEGEENEGMIGNYLNFGAVGKEHVVNKHTVTDEFGNTTTIEQDDVFILIAPQSMVGIESSIIQPLQEMVDAAGDRPVILINPDLSDKQSAQGQQGIRGRKERMEFAASFETIYHFQNLYVSGTSYFPILGSMTKLSPIQPWVAHQRRDLVDKGGEIYVPILASEVKPEGDVLLRTMET